MHEKNRKNGIIGSTFLTFLCIFWIMPVFIVLWNSYYSNRISYHSSDLSIYSFYDLDESLNKEYEESFNESDFIR